MTPEEQSVKIAELYVQIEWIKVQLEAQVPGREWYWQQPKPQD